MLGSDLYKLEGIETVYGTELKSLVLLYREIIGQDAVATFLSLIFQEKTNFKELSYLLNCLNLSVTNFEAHLEALEKVSLVDSYQKDKQYIFELKKPLSYRNFIDHELYGRMLIRKVDQSYYQYLIQRNLYDHSDKTGYKLVNHKNDFEELADWDEAKEEEFRKVKTVNIESDHAIDSFFPIYDFMKGVSAFIFPISLRTLENLKEIALIADTYGISEERMRINLMNATTVTPAPAHLDINKLRNLCRKSKTEIRYSADNPYQIPCATFITNLQAGKELTPNDKRIIDKLVNEYHLKPEVINVLIEHCLKESGNKLISSYVYAIAANWYRNDIDSYQKALEEINTPLTTSKKKTRTKKQKEEVLPVYEASNDFDLSEDDIQKYLNNTRKD